jgi:hypothetical protein
MFLDVLCNPFDISVLCGEREEITGVVYPTIRAPCVGMQVGELVRALALALDFAFARLGLLSIATPRRMIVLADGHRVHFVFVRA